jgi:dihydrofolate reductase
VSGGIALVIIVAMAENGVIGRRNRLPWRLRSDLRRFRALTLGKPIIMGRKTFASIGKPLDGRTNIVVSRAHDFAAPGVLAAQNFSAALAAARGDALRRGADAIAVVGGAEIYREALPLADRILATLVHARPDGDTAFPAIEPATWRVCERSEQPAGPGDDVPFAFIRYQRMGGATNALNAPQTAIAPRHERAL